MSKKVIKFLLIFIMPVFLMTGCSDLVEVQDRDFVLAIGVSQAEGQYEVLFANPDFGSDTKEEGADDNSFIHNYKSSYISEIEDMYNSASDKRLDYRHLEVIILDKKISNNKAMLEELIEYLKRNYEISRNVLVFYYSGDVKEIFEMNGTLNKSIGDYLKKMDDNIREKFGIKPTTIGNLMGAFSQNQPIIIPSLNLSEESVKINGGSVFYDGEFKKELNENEFLMYLTAKGEGQEYTIYVMDSVPVILKKISSSLTYEYKQGNPKVSILIKTQIERAGSEKGISEEVLSLAVTEYLNESIISFIQSCVKEDKLDLLKLYDMSAVKNKQIWLDYEGHREDFIDDLEVIISIEAGMQ